MIQHLSWNSPLLKQLLRFEEFSNISLNKNQNKKLIEKLNLIGKLRTMSKKSQESKGIELLKQKAKDSNRVDHFNFKPSYQYSRLP